jgi:phage terminase large subunit GpA-like protein
VLALIDDVERRARRSFVPPPRLSLSSWIESHLRLPADVAALAGPVELFPFTREIADCMSDTEHERVTLVKATRLGFTTLLIGCLGPSSKMIRHRSCLFCQLPMTRGTWSRPF